MLWCCGPGVVSPLFPIQANSRCEHSGHPFRCASGSEKWPRRKPRLGSIARDAPTYDGTVPTYRVRTAAMSASHDVSAERVEELRAALEAVGARSVDVAREVTFELDAQRASEAMADVAEVLFALSWPPAVTASIVR